MNLLIGLPLKIFQLLFVVLRLAWPLLVVLLMILIRRKLRSRTGYQNQSRQATEESAGYNGPVVEVDYRVVEDDEEN